MIVYFGIVLVMGLMFLLVQYKKFPQKANLVFILFMLFFVSSFRRSNIGADYPDYIHAFYMIGITGTYYMEKGYVLLNRLLYSLNDNYYMLAIGTNLLFFLPFYYYITKSVDKDYWPLCILVFVCNPYMFIQGTFNAIRQNCAVGILFIAIVCLLNNRYVEFSMFVLLAAQFHEIAYIGFFLVPLFKIKIRKRTWIIIATVMFIFSLIGNVSILYPIARTLHYAGYLRSHATKLNIIPYKLFIYIFILFLCSKYEILFNDSKETMFVKLYIFSLCFLLLGVTRVAIYRVYTMLAYMSLPAIPIIWERLQNSRNSIFVKLGYIVYYFGFYSGYILNFALTRNSYYYPFRFCF